MADTSRSKDPVGLCLQCGHARQIAHPHGGLAYWRCGLSDTDPKYPKYPRLPVMVCEGFEHEPAGEGGNRDQ